jgi:hypothetical protein
LSWPTRKFGETQVELLDTAIDQHTFVSQTTQHQKLASISLANHRATLQQRLALMQARQHCCQRAENRARNMMPG